MFVAITDLRGGFHPPFSYSRGKYTHLRAVVLVDRTESPYEREKMSDEKKEELMRNWKTLLIMLFVGCALGTGGLLAQDTGACWSSIACMDGFTEAECTSVGGINWQADYTCEETGITWSGGCNATLPNVGEVCMLVTSEGSCGAGEYLGDGVFCDDDTPEAPEPVPTLPVSGTAVLLLVLLGGALLVIKVA